MNKIEIETYRNQTIFYNDDTDKFECDIVVEDKNKETKRQSLKAVRTEIDAFVKLNAKFTPFKVMVIGLGYGDTDEKRFEGSCDVRTVESVRKDGKIVVSNSRGGKDYYVPNNSSSYDGALQLRKYNPALLEIEKEWKEHLAIWDAKQKELKEKAKPFIESIDTSFVTDFTK
jgi:hypothetical protein